MVRLVVVRRLVRGLKYNTVVPRRSENLNRPRAFPIPRVHSGREGSDIHNPSRMEKTKTTHTENQQTLGREV